MRSQGALKRRCLEALPSSSSATSPQYFFPFGNFRQPTDDQVNFLVKFKTNLTITTELRRKSCIVNLGKGVFDIYRVGWSVEIFYYRTEQVNKPKVRHDFRSPNPKFRRVRVRQSFHFRKIPGGLNINIFLCKLERSFLLQ